MLKGLIEFSRRVRALGFMLGGGGGGVWLVRLSGYINRDKRFEYFTK